MPDSTPDTPARATPVPTPDDATVPTGVVQPDEPRATVPREIWVLVAAAFCVALGFGFVSPILPAYARSFDVGVQAAAAIVSVFALMRLVFAPAGGALIGRFGERTIYLTGLLVVALSTGACALAEDYWHLLLYRGLGGIGSTMFTVSGVALLVRLSPPTLRGRVSSLYGGGFLVGSIMGPVMGSLMLGLGYRMPFVIYAATLIAAAVVVAVFLSGTSLRPAPGSTPLPVLGLAEALRDGAYRALLVSGFANGWSNFGVRVALLPLFAFSVPTLGIAWAGVALTAFAVGNGIALSLAGKAVDEIGRRPFIIAGLAVNGLATALVGISHSPVVLLVISVVGGLGAGVLNPAQQASIADIVGTERGGGKVVAAYQMAMDAGAIAGPVLAGRVADVWGFGWAFGLTGILTCAALIAWLPARDTLARP
ncbi:MAG: MFS transporter [Actinobacteria bacterium]|nr:MFS transporter [Actinomycetota bacterium]